MAGQSQGRRGAITGINVTPLVDITLVLLIIFMVTARVAVSPALSIDLPQASESQAVSVVFSVIVSRDGQMFVNGTAVANLDALEQKAKLAWKESPRTSAVIQADAKVEHARIMSVLNRLKRAGISQIAFATQQVRQEASRP